MIREDYADLVYLTAEEKYSAIIEDVKKCKLKKQPVSNWYLINRVFRIFIKSLK